MIGNSSSQTSFYLFHWNNFQRSLIFSGNSPHTSFQMKWSLIINSSNHTSFYLFHWKNFQRSLIFSENYPNTSFQINLKVWSEILPMKLHFICFIGRISRDHSFSQKILLILHFISNEIKFDQKMPNCHQCNYLKNRIPQNYIY